MQKLIEELKQYISRDEALSKHLCSENTDKMSAVYPFNKIEYIMVHLAASGLIDLQTYLNLRNSYIKRNKYLPVFEISAPRGFGETWAQKHLNSLVPEFERPSSKYDSEYSGQYDFWYNGIKIEVKASRGVDSRSSERLVVKALSSDTDKPFNMNFQQIKPGCCDVFIWMAVWLDRIDYWVLSSEEVESSCYYSHGQHRGNTGEGQLWITRDNIREFDKYLADPKDILNKVVEKGQVRSC